MSQIFVPTGGGGGGGGVILTISGNDGVHESPVANNFSIVTANATPQFIGSPGTETLDFKLSNLIFGTSNPATGGAAMNVGLGFLALDSITTASNNVAIGYQALHTTITGLNNVAVGYLSLNNSTGSNNLGIGAGALNLLTSGASNIGIGQASGSNYTSNESGNIVIGSSGVTGDQNVMRLGFATTTTTYSTGIAGVTVSNPQMVVINSTGGNAGQLGVQALTQNNVLVGGASNAVSQIPTVVNGTLVTSITGVPSISQVLPLTVQGNITTLGTITSGVWNGSAIPAANGGTGSSNFSGNKTLLSSQTASSSTSINFTGVIGVSPYSYYVLEFYEVIMSQSTDHLAAQVSTNNGSTYSASGYTQSGYAATAAAALSGFNGASGNYFTLLDSVGTSSSTPACGTASFYCFESASLNKMMISNSAYTNSAPSLYQVQTSGMWATITVVNALRVTDIGGGNIVSGTFNLYGVS